METTSLFNTDKNKTSTYSSIDGDSSSSRVNQAAQLIRDAYLGFQDAPVEGYYDVSLQMLLILKLCVHYCLLTKNTFLS